MRLSVLIIVVVFLYIVSNNLFAAIDFSRAKQQMIINNIDISINTLPEGSFYSVYAKSNEDEEGVYSMVGFGNASSAFLRFGGGINYQAEPGLLLSFGLAGHIYNDTTIFLEVENCLAIQFGFKWSMILNDRLDLMASFSLDKAITGHSAFTESALSTAQGKTGFYIVTRAAPEFNYQVMGVIGIASEVIKGVAYYGFDIESHLLKNYHLVFTASWYFMSSDNSSQALQKMGIKVVI